MRRGTGVEVPVGRALRLMRNAGRLKGSVEAPGVEGVGGAVREWWLQMGCHHRLLRLERRPWTQDSRARSEEGHLPCLHHTLPWVEARDVGRALGVGVVRARVPAATAAALPFWRRRSLRLL